ncbi:MAG TPA: dephospho-CoA kinase [Bacillota bacterium]|nr:dephospho-CoA kinase [Bacillota bacterium]
MQVIGLTGGIATGKSTVSKILRENDIPVIDADEIYKELSQKNGRVWQAIYNGFGEKYIDKKGEIDKKALSKLVFDKPEQREKLNKATHPLIKAEVSRRIQKFKDIKDQHIIFIDVPLLYESGWHEIADQVWVVAIPYEIQLERLIKRDKCSEDYAKKRINSQMSLGEKCKRANVIIDNSNTIEHTSEQVLSHLRRTIAKD